MPSGKDERRAELAQLRSRLAVMKARYDASQRLAASLRQALEQAKLALEIRTGERRMLEIRTAEAVEALDAARLERDRSQKAVFDLKVALSGRLDALYRLGRLGYLQPLARSGSPDAFLRSLQLMSFLVRRDATLLRDYGISLETLRVKQEELLGRQKDFAALIEETRKKERELTAARAEQAVLLRRTETEEARQREAVTKLEEKTARLEALLDLQESRGRSLAPGAVSIRSYKGALDWPLQGSVAVPFGRIRNPRFPSTFLRSNGWTIAAEPGTEVRAVFGGDVAYSQWMKGYGNLVVLDHGDGVFTLYGRLMPGAMSGGGHVSLGEVIGRVGQPMEDEPQGLYFEVRDSRSSVDPGLWLR